MLTSRRDAVLPFAVLGAGCVVAGGLLSAITAIAPSPQASWLVAYLVLVCGVAQLALGAGQGWLAPRTPSRRHLTAEFTSFNAGNAAVLAGALTELPILVDVGGALLVIGLAMIAYGARGGGERRHRWPLHGFRTLLVLLLVSIPVGLVLARIGPV